MKKRIIEHTAPETETAPEIAAETTATEVAAIEAPAGVTLEVAKGKKKATAPTAPPAPAKPEIVSAQYGTEGNMVEVDVKATNLRVGRKASNRLVAADPVPKVKKILIVNAIVDGVEQTFTFAEGDIVKF